VTSHDHIPEPRYLPVPVTKPQPRQSRRPRFATLRAWWTTSWERGGFLYERWEDVRRAPGLGWHGMANWLKALLALAGASVVVLLFNGAVDVVLNALHQLLTAAPRVQVGTDTSHGVFAVVDQPVRTYIAAHCAGLQISASTVYRLWQIVGLFGLIGGAFRSTGARLTWVSWGAASVAMVYSAAPAGGRTIATALAVLAWTAASALALRGLSLRPTVFTHIHNATPAFESHLHLPALAAPPAGEDTPEGPGNVRTLHTR
jgi:hypothetical protein